MNEANTFNIEATLNAWLKTAIDGLDPPAFFSGFPSTRFILNMPESPINVPAYSGHHLFIETEDAYQGRRGDGGSALIYRAFFDVSVWVSRRNSNFTADKRWMCAALKDIVLGAKSVVLTDYLTNYPASSAGEVKIYIDGIEARQTEQDVNPDIDRERFLILYHTILMGD